MLKKFFFSVLSSFVGAWLAIVLSGLVIAIILFAAVGGMIGNSSGGITDNTVLRINLSGAIVERFNGNEVNLETLLLGRDVEINSLESLTVAIKEASANKKVKAIYLDCGFVSSGLATLDEIRHQLLEFKKSGKKIYAYADQMSQGAYYVASVADTICLNPAGSFELSGLGGQALFYKQLFDKLGIEFEVVRVGEGKSAVEPYVCDSMSNYARTQSLTLLNNLWAPVCKSIAKSRNFNASKIDTLINEDYILCRSAQFIKKNKLVDCLKYRHTFESEIARNIGQGDKLESFVTPKDLDAYSSISNGNSSDSKIAVLYAYGAIDDILIGNGINSSQLVETILQLADDDQVKGLVLRVNSPGGSAYGSEQIWDALETFKRTGKPFIVSMGDYAASGGYYISCGADRIFADKLTVTGSIGIFGLIPNAEKLCKNIGLHSEMVATNPAAQYPNLTQKLTPQQYEAMQKMVERGYSLFVKRCSEGRKIPVSTIEAIADGRPLDATTAKELRLIDEIAYFSNAVDYAAKKANLKDDYEIVSYPSVDTSLLSMFGSVSDLSEYVALICNSQIDWSEKTLRVISNLCNYDRVRASMPSVKIKI